MCTQTVACCRLNYPTQPHHFCFLGLARRLFLAIGAFWIPGVSVWRKGGLLALAAFQQAFDVFPQYVCF